MINKNSDNLIGELQLAARDIRCNLLKLCSMQNIHIGGDLSSADMITALWQYFMKYNPLDPKDELRDRFILSKGHASAVVTFNQAAIGCFDDEDVYREYATDTGRFSMHSCNLINPFVEVSTGSLGHGMPVACGIAKALQLKNNIYNRVYVLTGDGEHCEGSMWEAVANAYHEKLGNLVVIVDNNGLSADGSLDKLTGIGSIADKYKSYGWIVFEIDGNSMKDIVACLSSLPNPVSSVPIAIVGHTIKGKGVSFMENQGKWHSGKITQEECDMAINELRNCFE